MATIFKRKQRDGTLGAVWYAKGRDATGKRWRRSTRQTSRRAAERVANRFELENALPPDVEAWTLGQALDAAYELGELRENADTTMARYLTYGAHLVRILDGNTNVNAANLVELGEFYLKTRRKEKTRQGSLTSDHTIAKEVRFLCMGLRRGRVLERFAGEHTAFWPTVLKDYYTPGDRWLPPQEFDALLSAEAASVTARPKLRKPRHDWLLFYVHTGCSQGEIHKIRKDTHVDLERRLVFIPGGKTKYRGRWVPLTDEALAVVKRRLKTPGPMLFAPVWHRSKMNTNLQDWCKHAGIARCNATDLRRTYCSWMFQAGVPEIQVIKYMGHANSKMVRRVYAQLSDGMHQDAIERFGAVANVGQQNVVPIGKSRKNRRIENRNAAKNA